MLISAIFSQCVRASANTEYRTLKFWIEKLINIMLICSNVSLSIYETFIAIFSYWHLVPRLIFLGQFFPLIYFPRDLFSQWLFSHLLFFLLNFFLQRCFPSVIFSQMTFSHFIDKRVVSKLFLQFFSISSRKNAKELHK